MTNINYPRVHYEFIHNALADFMQDTLDIFYSELYPRFNWKVMDTYDKAVEYLDKKAKAGHESDKPNLPAIIMNPMADLAPAESNAGGLQLFRFQNLAPGLLTKLFEPIYRDENISIVPGFSRITGSISFLTLLNSIYEFFDFQLLLTQFFGGFNRYIFPKWVNSFIILGNYLETYTYENDETGVRYQLDWDKYGAYDTLVRTTNRNEVAIPVKMKPIYKMTDMSDDSERRGGADKLADYRLTFNVEYEIEIPVYLAVFENHDLTESTKHIKLNVSYGSTTSDYLNKDFEYSNEYQQVVDKQQSTALTQTERKQLIKIEQEKYNKLAGFLYDPEGNIIKDVQYPPVNQTTYKSTIGSDNDPENITVEESYAQLIAKYIHRFTKSEIDSTANIEITLPIKIENPDDFIYSDGFKVNSKFGMLTYKYHFGISDDGINLILYMDKIHDLNENDFLEIFYYKIGDVEQ